VTLHVLHREWESVPNAVVSGKGFVCYIEYDLPKSVHIALHKNEL
jgi:hypothetical protein